MQVTVNQFGIDNGGDFTGIATTKFPELVIRWLTGYTKAGLAK